MSKAHPQNGPSFSKAPYRSKLRLTPTALDKRWSQEERLVDQEREKRHLAEQERQERNWLSPMNREIGPGG